MDREIYERLMLFSESGEINRLGKLFSTEENNYFYDTGTGKIVKLDDLDFYIINALFKGNVAPLAKNADNISHLIEFIKNENLFSAIKPNNFYINKKQDRIIKTIDYSMEQLIIKLTGKCNFKCKYCVYNESFETCEEFNDKDIDIITAKKAVDYFIKHSNKTKPVAITFYGGEPLIKYDLMKDIIKYSIGQSKKENINIEFSFTSNLYLLNDEMIDFFKKVDNLSILCSIDGDKKSHDEYRIISGGKGTFDTVYENFVKLVKEFKYVNKDSNIAVNSVFAPPYTYEKLDRMENFANSVSEISDKIDFGITYPTEGSIINYIDNFDIYNNPKYNTNFGDFKPLLLWQKKHFNGKYYSENTNTYIGKHIAEALVDIDKRYLADKAYDNYNMNSCCIPGLRRLYVNTDGKYYLCERIGLSPSIGDVEFGINKENIKKHYLDEFNDKTMPYCSKCWAIRFCSLCYSDRYTEDGYNEKFNLQGTCESIRNSTKDNLILYHEYREKCPENLNFIKNTEYI
ncbi:radical SAM protein [Peptostreptococcus faecalis]|uniref:radical SAM protein n=1 Tax=Peptostreptococcus faecalis TaxID=2045015 RepID=UPI000C7E1240|nr:radical SAM protein [Peptostreptococcus faecalis]